MADVDDDRAAGSEPVAGEREELARGEVERDVGLAVGVDEDRVEAAGRFAQERPGVLGVEVEVAAREPEPTAAQRGDLAVYLHGVDARIREEVAERPRGGAAGVAEDR